MLRSKDECKLFYGPKFEEMKKKKCREKVQRFREKPGNREKELEQKRKSYPGAQATKKKKYYDTRKKDSTLNDLKYRKSIQFGPLFICVCCHAGLFKRNVKVFTKKLLNNIDPEILQNDLRIYCGYRNSLPI